MKGNLQVGDLLFNAAEGTVSREGITLLDGGRTLEVFGALVAASPDALDTQTLAERVWNRDHVSDDTISKRISLLRQALGSDRYVQTLPGRRYRIAVPVSELEDTPINAEPQAHWTRSRALLGVILFASLVAVMLIVARQRERAMSGADQATVGEPRMFAPDEGEPARMVGPDGAVLEAPHSVRDHRSRGEEE